ncbi:hypothetical protein FKF61_21685 [Salmonella enterica]|uniref:Phage protein n=2 Tax=Tlsvirus TaxID=1920865 RepID=A0A653FYM6_9CAUD|nr:gp62 [Escherichia phage Tls]EBH2608626.1 hypothetical protein [Salmonella enterica]EGK3006770.1 hypothetical protein [Salmonella enterica subsp. enterica serovar Kentucky]QIN92585.1 hypothetical protein [Phage NBSal001]VUF54911.1 Phage protein [Escherichia phage Stevie_ev116]AAR09293.1 hypothetical protein GJGTLS_62 [Escherichia phage Tls]
MSIRLADHMKWDLFVGMTIRLLDKHGYNADKMELINCLDMTFDEIKVAPLYMWERKIEHDLIQYKRREGARFFNVK